MIEPSVPITATAQKSLPYWAQITTFAIATALGVIKLRETFPFPKLDVNLTRDLFFRFGDYGEGLFCQAALIANGASVLVLGVTPTLKRVALFGDRKAEKIAPHEVVNFGERVRGSQHIAENHFYGSSPLSYLEANKPFRAVYLCINTEHAEAQKLALNAFDTAVSDLRVKSAGTILDDEESKVALIEALTTLIDQHYNSMLRLLQLESGQYTLEVTVTYRGTGWWAKRLRTQAKSSVTFAITTELLESMRKALRTTLLTRGNQLFAGQTLQHPLPELAPTSVREVIK